MPFDAVMRNEPEDLVVLRKARELIEWGWTGGVRARTAGGAQVHPLHPLATRFCLTGAIWRATEGKWWPRQRAYRQLRQALDVWVLHKFNDSHRQADVLAALDDAITIRCLSLREKAHV